MRIGVLLSLLFLLGACSNRVVSDRPWFTKEAEANAPRLRPGLWVAMTPDGLSGKKCRFDEETPFEAWPRCVSGFVVRDDETLQLEWSETTERGRTTRTYFWDSSLHTLSGGDPIVDQVEKCPGLRKIYDDTSGKARDPAGYCFDAVRPTRLDAAGQVIAAVRWPVLCGPWPSKAQAKRSGKVVTAKPFPGLHVVYENCTADSKDSLRRAAKASETLASPNRLGPIETHWVRFGYR